MLPTRHPLARPIRWTLLAATLVPAQMDNSGAEVEKPGFEMSVKAAVQPGEVVTVRLGAEHVKQLQFRLYRVQDPAALFGQLKDPSSFAGTARPLGPRTWLERFNDWRNDLRASLRDLVRRQFGVEHRAEIRDWRLSGDARKRAEERLRAVRESKKYTGDTYANVPLVNVQRLERVWNYNVPSMKNRWDTVEMPVRLDHSGVYLLEATNADKRTQLILIASRMVVVTEAQRGKLVLRDVTMLAHHGEDWAALAVPCWNVRSAHLPWSGVVYTDRPIYRPGHEVHIKAILREKRMDGLAVPSRRAVDVTVNDGDGKTLLRTEATLSDYGTVSADLKLPEAAQLGYYQFEVAPRDPTDADGSLDGNFKVEEYRKPEFEVRLSSEQPRFVQGATQHLTMSARYFYGEPVRTGRIEWKVSRDSWSAGDSSDDEDSDTDEGGEGGGYSSGSNEDVLTAKTALDAEGKATLAIPTEFVGRDQMYSVNAEVMDASGQTVANETYFVATAGPFYLRATWANYIYKVGAPGSLSVVAMNYDGIAVPGVAFTASLHRVETLLPGQNESEHIEREVLRLSGRTGTDGCSELQFVAPAEGACSFIVETRSTAASSTSVSHS